MIAWSKMSVMIRRSLIAYTLGIVTTQRIEKSKDQEQRQKSFGSTWEQTHQPLQNQTDKPNKHIPAYHIAEVAEGTRWRQLMGLRHEAGWFIMMLRVWMFLMIITSMI